MSASPRDRYVAGERPDWRGARPADTPRRRRNQYTPLLERPWFLWTLGVACIALLVASSQGWV